MTLRVDLVCQQGEDFFTDFAVRDSAGNSLLSLHTSARMQWRKWPENTLILEATTLNNMIVIDAIGGDLSISIPGTVLSGIRPAKYMQDLFIYGPSKKLTRFMAGTVRLFPQVTVGGGLTTDVLVPSENYTVSENSSVFYFGGALIGEFFSFAPSVAVPSENYTDARNSAVLYFGGVLGDFTPIIVQTPFTPSYDYRDRRNAGMRVFRGLPRGGYVPPTPPVVLVPSEDYSVPGNSAVFYFGGELTGGFTAFTPPPPPVVLVPSANYFVPGNSSVFYFGGELTDEFTPLS